MDRYVTGAVIRTLREGKRMTQEELAEKIHVSGKAVSKWETGQGFPDVSLLEPISEALGISVSELLSGARVRNRNRSANMAKGRFYVCPVCGNVIFSAGEAMISCCGITLPPQEAEPLDAAGEEMISACGLALPPPEPPAAEHAVRVEKVEDEYYVFLDHPMTKEHYISFLAAVSDREVQLVKLYPEGEAGARFKRGGVKTLYACCNRHGLFQLNM